MVLRSLGECQESGEGGERERHIFIQSVNTLKLWITSLIFSPLLAALNGTRHLTTIVRKTFTQRVIEPFLEPSYLIHCWNMRGARGIMHIGSIATT